jgi:hypothetical protein
MRTSVAMSSSLAPQTRRGRGSTKQEGGRDREGLACGFHLHPFLPLDVFFFLLFWV